MIAWPIAFLLATTLAVVASASFALGSTYERLRNVERERVSYGRGIVRGMQLRDDFDIAVVEVLDGDGDEEPRTETH